MKTAFIAIVGRANVGKSTLLNSIVGQKVAIVSDKPQTTRNRITGIYNSDQVQFVFVDTPGLHKPRNKLGERMIREVSEALDGIDAVLMVVEPRRPGSAETRLIEKLSVAQVPVILVINKVDINSKADVAQAIDAYSKLFDFASIVPVSALESDGVDIILDELMPFAEECDEPFYPDDIPTSQTVRQMVCEIMREKILLNMYDEVPHGVAVEVVSFSERQSRDGSPVTDISVDIMCERDSHKSMIIGKSGEKLKKIASQARADIEQLVGMRVNLKCFVKVRENWRNNDRIISELHLYDQ